MYFYFYNAYIFTNPIFDHLLESSHRDNSDKWSNIGFGEELIQGESIKVNLMHIILIHVSVYYNCRFCRGVNYAPSRSHQNPVPDPDRR